MAHNVVSKLLRHEYQNVAQGNHTPAAAAAEYFMPPPDFPVFRNSSKFFSKGFRSWQQYVRGVHCCEPAQNPAYPCQAVLAVNVYCGAYLYVCCRECRSGDYCVRFQGLAGDDVFDAGAGDTPSWYAMAGFRDSNRSASELMAVSSSLVEIPAGTVNDAVPFFQRALTFRLRVLGTILMCPSRGCSSVLAGIIGGLRPRGACCAGCRQMCGAVALRHWLQKELC